MEDIIHMTKTNLKANHIRIENLYKSMFSDIKNTSIDLRDEYAAGLVDECVTQLNILCDIAVTQPQSAYIAYKYGFKSKFTYFQRTIPDFGQYLEPITTSTIGRPRSPIA